MSDATNTKKDDRLFNILIDNGVSAFNFFGITLDDLNKIIEAYDYNKNTVFLKGKRHLLGDVNEFQVYSFAKDLFIDGNQYGNYCRKQGWSKNKLLSTYIPNSKLNIHNDNLTSEFVHGEYGWKQKYENPLKVEKAEEIKKPISNNKIFISHSSKDDILVTSFVNNILQLGIGISDTDIFCTSIEGMNIRNGDDFREKIISEIKRSTAAILIITNNYKESEVCLNEMGAIWALDIKAFPLINDSLNFETIGFLLKVKQISKLSSDSGLDNFLNSFCEKLVIEPPRIPKWNQNRNKFLQELGNIPIDIPEPIAKKSLQPILKEGAYKFEGKDGLYCPVCFEKNGLTIPLSRSNNGIHHCSNCKGKFK